MSDLQALLDLRLEDAPHDAPSWQRAILESLSDERLVARLRPVQTSLRPGGTWSGPSQFEMIDMVGFLLVVALLPKGSDALTIACSVNFLQSPPFADLLAEARLLRLSGRSAVVDVVVTSPASTGIVARATVSYICFTGPDTPLAVAARRENRGNDRENENEDGARCT